jgi:hypothetical protein
MNRPLAAALLCLPLAAAAQSDAIAPIIARAKAAAQVAAKAGAARPLPTPGTIDAELAALLLHDWQFKLPGHVLPDGGVLDDGDRFIYTFKADGSYVARQITDYPIPAKKGTWTLVTEPQAISGHNVSFATRLTLTPGKGETDCGWIPCGSEGAVYVGYNAFEDSLLFWGGNISGSVKFFGTK